jgi:N-acetylmuramoyl-L-alanine amidase
MTLPVSPLRMYEIVLMALTLWREARGESFTAKVAVAFSIKNRVDHPAWWGDDVISVLIKKWQYSSLTDPHDTQLTKWPTSKDPVFEECLNIAMGVMSGTYSNPVPGADSYYDDSLQGEARPKWAKENPDRFVGKYGRLNFYNLDRDVDHEAA